jgi:tetratricopeptide (TPR) repeat protein
MNLGRFTEAEPYLKKSVVLNRAAWGEQDRQVVDALKLLGALYTRLGNRQRAGECYAEALEIMEKPKAD